MGLDRIIESEDLSIPNLDDMSVDPLDYEEMEMLFCKLAEWCQNKKFSMRYRRKGHVTTAAHFEREMERIYENLPEKLKW